MGQTWHCAKIFACNFGGQRLDGSRTMHSQSGPIYGCFFGQSSFCNPAIVQAASCVKVNPDLPLSVVCALGCGFQTGAGSVFNVVKPAKRRVRYLAIFGVGGVGFAAIMAARYLANENPGILDVIIAVDYNDERLNMAKEFGATHVINPQKDNLRDRVAQITKNENLDAAVDCTGAIPVVNDMIGLIGPGGMAITVGGPAPGLTASVDVFDMLIGAKTYRGCHQGNAYAKEVSLRLYLCIMVYLTGLSSFPS
jgi:aryl-alcohol dehydrogenase